MNNTSNTINKISLEGFIDFAAEANGRSTPSVQDGLKVVHRRILYDMYNNAYNKVMGSAKIVGSVLGAYHPHGDTSVYDAAVRLSQPFKMRYPLIEFEGNNGSLLEPEGYAASRYTKMKLSKFGQLMGEGLEKECVDFVENYNGDTTEPVVLPGIFPQLLCNPSMGIGVGLSTNIVSHNLREVCDGIEACIDKPGITVEELMQHIKGPDFPTGGVIMDTNKLLDIYTTGKGSVRLRAKYNIQQIDGRNVIVVTEIPYLTDIETGIIKKIQQMVNEEGYEDIYDLQNNSGKQGIELHIILEKGVNVNKVLRKLFEETGLETTVKINNTVIIGKNEYATLSIKGLVSQYLKHQYDVIVRSAQYDKNKAAAKLHVLLGLIKALEDIDNVVAIIKNSKNKEDAQKKLIAHLIIDEIQAKAILDMKLSKLTSLEVETLKKDIIDLEKEIARLEKIINSKAEQNKIIKSNLDLMRKMSDDRRTLLVDLNMGQTTGEEVFLLLKNNNRVCAICKDEIEVKNKGTKGSSISKDEIVDIIKTNTKETVYCISDNGYAYPLPVSLVDISADALKEQSVNIGELISIEGNIIQLLKITPDTDYLISISEKGVSKKTNLDAFNFNRKEQQICKIKSEDSLFKVLCAKENDNIIIVQDNNKICNFSVEEIKTMGKGTIGAKIIGASKVLAATVAGKDSNILFWDNSGKGNLTSFNEVPVNGKGSSGNVGMPDCIGALNVDNTKYVSIIGENNKSITIDISSMNSKSAKAKGVKIYNGQILKIINS